MLRSIGMGGIVLLAAFSQGALAGPTATIDYMEYAAVDVPSNAQASMEAAAVPSSNTFRNPVLPGFHPDPSIVRVGDDFYTVTSTFSWFPGLPVLHSKDLVNWRLIGNAIDRPSQVDFSGLGTNRGLFAPAISYHNGKFWIVNTCIECGGNFVIMATDPAGPWSDPVWLDFGGIDPSLYFADDGTAWITYNDAPPGPPRYEGHRAIWIQQFDPGTMRMMAERELLVDGGVNPSDNPVWAEGPHIYKIDGWYYLLTAEGGTAYQHSQTIYRSRELQGPYRPGPINPILTQRDLPADRQDRVEATGHADIVQLGDGTWWGVFLATRPFVGQSTLLGRETFLLPLEWKDGWPRFLEQGEPVPMELPRPNLPSSQPVDYSSWRDDFNSPLSDEWIGLRTPGPEQQLTVDTTDGVLQLVAGSAAAGSSGKPAFVGRRLRHHSADIVMRIDFEPSRPGAFAGLLALMDENHFLAVGKEQGRLVVRLRTDVAQDETGEVVAEQPLQTNGPLELQIALRGGSAQLSWRGAQEDQWQMLCSPIKVEPLASVHAGLFTGLVIGPYAYAPD
ncbi:glycoside hydrolase family 43 protein [Erythrobacter litoralis]|uniref:glycoside hydrolase family 43 protein n=1 Tax=Erythrobacter litoralis TaxID=39960 RepID=UPI002435FBB8|nr:glycoside hydrolase family 43 protein [Erythrobacter litoralis]MDG6078071.1 glycoside hydrolase family 43 protein [Erythrobacter litoralis]